MRDDRQSVRGAPAGRWRGWAAIGLLAFVLLGAAFAARNAETGTAVALLTGAGLLALGYLGTAVLEPLHRRVLEATAVERAAVERAESLQATCGEGILVLDEDGTIADWNHAAERIFGYPGHEVLGANVQMVLAELEMRDASPALAREMIGRRRDGVEVPLEIELSARTADGLRFLVVRDSGRLRAAEASARAAEEERRRVAAAALEAILVFDRDGRIQEANPAAERLIGKPWSQLSGRDFADTLLHRDQRATFKRDVRDAFAGQQDRIHGRGDDIELWITGRPAIRAHVSFARAGGRFFAFVLPEGRIGAHDAALPAREQPTAVRDLPAGGRDATPVARELPAAARDIPTGARDLPAALRELPGNSRETPAASRELPAISRNGTLDARPGLDAGPSAGLNPDGGLHWNRPR